MIRIEVGNRGHRQNRAVVRVHDDRRAAGGVPFVDSSGKSAFGDELHDGVDGQDHIVAVDRPVRALAADEIHSAARVAKQRDATGTAAHLRVERMLDAGKALAIEADVTDDIRRE